MEASGRVRWEGYFDGKVIVRSAGNFEGMDAPKTMMVYYLPPPPHPSLSGDIKTQTPLTITPALFYLYPTMKTTKTAGGRDVRYPREIFRGGRRRGGGVW